MRLIDAEALEKAMYHEAFEKDSDMQKWDSGCWIRYKMFENVIADAQTVDTIVIPKGATNEDVLRNVFPNFEEDITPKGDTLILERYTPYCKMQLHKDWLDAPYKGGKEE